MPKVLITAGATRERIDPVRFISNDSSGRQGYAIAKTFSDNGHEVVLVSGFADIEPPEGVKLINVESAEQMLVACLDQLPCDIFIAAAAVCDFKPKEIAANKIKKQTDINEMTLHLVKNPDILKTVANHKKRPQIVIGFAAETENLIENAKVKLESKGCDFIIANNVAEGVFGSKDNEVSIISKNNVQRLPKMSKAGVALEVFEVIEESFKNE